MGAGTILTLTPQDSDEIGRQCPAISDVAPIVRARSQIVYGNRNWVPYQISGTTPAFLAVRDWEDFSEGGMFSDRDVRNWNKVCVIGATIKRELFDRQSPIGKEIRINNVSFRILGVLSRKGANMMGMDQDDVRLAPWTTIKFRVAGTLLSNGNQSGSASGSTDTSATSTTVNTLSNVYPASTTSLYSTPTSTQTADTPQPIRFTNVDQILAKATSENETTQAIGEITELLRERHRIRAGDAEDFNIRDMTELTRTLASASQTMGTLLLVVALISLVVGGVGIMNIMLVLGDRADAGNRSPHGRRRPDLSYPSAVPGGGRGFVSLRRGAGHRGGPRHLNSRPLNQALAYRTVAGGDHRRRGRFGNGGGGLRLLSGVEGVAVGPHRSAAV